MIEIVSATRLSEDRFWNDSALGISLRRLAQDARLVARIAFGNKLGLPEVYNARIGAPDGHPILVFIHDDVWIDDGFFADRIIQGLKSFDVIGVAGNRRRVRNQPAWAFVDENLTWDAQGNLSGSVAHSARPSGNISVYGDAPAECELLDGVLLAAEKSKLNAAGVQFDPRFDFDFYDMDFCRSARKNGLRLGTWPISITHQSERPFGSSRWKGNRRLYQEKWEEIPKTAAGMGRVCFAVVDDQFRFYRSFLPASELAKRGFRVSLIKNPDAQTLRAFDTVVFETPFSAGHYELIRRLKGEVRLVLDLDDNYHEIEPSNPRYAALTAARAAITRVIESVDEVIVSTEPLREFYSAFNDRITVLPNMIPPGLFLNQDDRPARSGPLRVGWHGGFSHNADLKILETVLPRVHKEFPDVRFVFFGNTPRLNIPNAEYHGPVPYAAFPAMLTRLRFDIGLAPLTNAPFNRYKTNLKWLEYSALGIPAVVSDVEPYSRSIEHGVDGFLVKTPEDWVRELGKLIRDPELRQAVGRRARESAVARFNCGAVGSLYADLASRWPAKERAQADGSFDAGLAPKGRDVFLAALLGTIAALVPPLLLLPVFGRAATAPRLLAAVALCQGLTLATVFAAVRACFTSHRAVGAFQIPEASSKSERGLADFYDSFHLRADRRISSLKALLPAFVVALAGLIPLAIVRRSHPWIPLALLYAGLAEAGILALIFASSYYLTSRRLPTAEVLPLEKFVQIH